MKRDVVIVDAIRTPFGKRGGALSRAHSVVLLGDVVRALLTRAGVEPADVDQIVGGCVGQVGMQTMDIARGAWLTAGLPASVAGTTVDAACGSSQQATNLGAGLIAAGLADVIISCGVELMSRVPMGSTVPPDNALGRPITRNYYQHHEFTTQYQGAERIAAQWGITRADCDEFGVLSQQRAAKALEEKRFASQLLPIDVADGDETGSATRLFDVDEGPRPTTIAGLQGLKPTVDPDGVHTAGTSSQIADGASAALLMSAEAAAARGLTPLAHIVNACLVGSDPVLMLTGPIPATTKILNQAGMSIGDIDVFEINEAFASIVLAWERDVKPDMASVNPNGGAIALGHPLGATGTALIAKAAHELVRADKEHALITMCCGGGMATGTLLRRC
jgi:acetyl-CoA C-acetyltransferase